MPGNAGRRGAVRKPGSKKGATVGSGGQRRRGLEGRGPTPRAEERVHHPAHKRRVEAERREAARPKRRTPAWVRALPADTEFVVGRNAVHEAVASGVPLHSVYVASGLTNDERVSAVLRSATARGVPMFEVSRAELETVADGASHQGLALAVPPYQYQDVRDVVARAFEQVRPPLFVALDGVTDPHNLGAVLRNAGAFGVDGVIVPQRRAAGVGATVWKVSAGALARVPVSRVTNLVRTLEELKEDGFFVVGLDAEGSVEIADLHLADRPLVVVTGAEGRGSRSPRPWNH